MRPLLTSLLAASLACSGAPEKNIAPTDDTPGSVVLSRTGIITLQLGATETVTGSVSTKDGRPLSTTIGWTTSNPEVATVVGGQITARKVGSATITATAGTVTATVNVVVTHGPPSQLVIVTQPSGAPVGGQLGTQPVIEIRDAGNNVVASSNAAVTATIVEGGGTLTGTTTVSAVNGVATFTNLGIDGGAGTRALGFSSAGLNPVVSGPVVMTLPPVAIIVVSSTSVSASSATGTNPAPVTVSITNGGSVALTGLTIDGVDYEIGQPTGWLVPSLGSTTAPTTLTLSFAGNALAPGVYGATVRIAAPGASNSPVSISVTLTIVSGYNLEYGTSAEKVRIVDVNANFLPATTVRDDAGAHVNGIPVSYASRATSIATVGTDGRITARAPGETWVVATAPLSRDSVYVIVPRAAGAPVFRTTRTTYALGPSEQTTITIVLDPRSVPVGAATLSVGYQIYPSDAAYVAVSYEVPQVSPPPQVTLTQSNQILISVASGTGIAAPLPVLQLTIIGRSTPGLSGWITLTALDVVGVNANDITSQVTSTMLPIVIR